MKFTQEQLDYLLDCHGLTADSLGNIKVRDGYVRAGELVWWRGECGPERVTLEGSHLGNAYNYPLVYQISKPFIEVKYLDSCQCTYWHFSHHYSL
jgi:hypothetical protein